jgi:hypothetical protein
LGDGFLEILPNVSLIGWRKNLELEAKQFSVGSLEGDVFPFELNDLALDLRATGRGEFSSLQAACDKAEEGERKSEFGKQCFHAYMIMRFLDWMQLYSITDRN